MMFQWSQTQLLKQKNKCSKQSYSIALLPSGCLYGFLKLLLTSQRRSQSGTFIMSLALSSKLNDPLLGSALSTVRCKRNVQLYGCFLITIMRIIRKSVLNLQRTKTYPYKLLFLFACGLNFNLGEEITPISSNLFCFTLSLPLVGNIDNSKFKCKTCSVTMCSPQSRLYQEHCTLVTTSDFLIILPLSKKYCAVNINIWKNYFTHMLLTVIWL